MKQVSLFLQINIRRADCSVFKRPRAKVTHSTPQHTIYWTSPLILFSHLRLSFPGVKFPSDFSTQFCMKL